MTENKQRSDVDAVLSSVRRIVTRQLPPDEMIPQDWDSETATQDDAESDKLLLTPALRVEDKSPVPIRPMPSQTPLEQRIAELERAVGAVSDDWEPDGSEPVDTETPRRLVLSLPANKRMPVEDAEPVFRAAERVDLLAEPAPDHLPDVADDDESDDDALIPHEAAGGELIDEDKLRELVSDIVRAELQGELGERITRNIRKLVRREIHRAIMTRDFG